MVRPRDPRWVPNPWSIAQFMLDVGKRRRPRGQAFRDLPYPVPTKTMTLEGREIAYVDVGSGERTLVLVHGLASNLAAWSRNISALAEHDRVVAIDLPGFGKSDKRDAPISIAWYADLVQALLERLAAPRPILVGHSMGAQIAMTHALRYRGHVERLVLTAPAGLETFSPAEAELLRSTVTPVFTRTMSPAQIRSSLAQNFWTMPAEAQFMLEHRLSVIDGPDFDDYCIAISRCVAAMLDEPVWASLGEIGCPAVVIFGEGDRMIPNRMLHRGSTRELAETATARFAEARLHVLPRAGHMAHFERPDAWNEIVRTFIRA